MIYSIENNKIIINNLQDFNINHILDCGQIFRYEINNNEAKVYSLDKFAKIKTFLNKVEIETDDVGYFVNFFDLNTNYSEIKNKLKKDEFLVDAIKYGYGIRILKNDLFEMIVSFIISANNNIKRIKNSIQYLCVNFGKNMGEYYAFPTLQSLKQATVLDFKNAGLGYRAEQLFETIQTLTIQQIENVKSLSRNEQFNFLISLKGIGEKVANCIMLFGLHNLNSFPVDTWINKVYNSLTHSNITNRKLITNELTNRYKDLSGYAQQYFFYYFRENKLK